MSLLTLSDLIAAYKTVSPDKEWALGGLEDANKFANAIEAAVIKKLATVSVEPVSFDYLEQTAYESWLETTAPSGDVESVQRQWERSSEFKSLYADKTIHTATQLAAARVQSDALLRQALEALAKYTTPGVLGGRVPIDAELVAAIKQHLGEV